MCYVGKASKIFICIVAVLVIAGMILAFRWVRHEPNHKSHNKCEGSSCPPPSFYPQPIPAATAAAAAAPSFSSPTPPSPQAGSAPSPLPP